MQFVEHKALESQSDLLDSGRIAGDSAMAALIRECDWSSTPLGPIAGWSDHLVCSVNLMLGCAFPSLIFWGTEMIQFYNDAFRPLIGEKQPAAVGQSARICWDEAWEIIGPQLGAVLERGATISQHKVLVPILRGGRLQDVWWNYSYSPITAPEGSVAGILVVCQDVTGELRAMHALEASEERATRILESIGDAVIVTDRESRITRMNPVAESLTGWSTEEAAGRPLQKIFRIVHERTREPLESPAEKVKRLGTVVSLANSTVLLRRDGSEVPLDDSAAPIRDAEGIFGGVVLVFRSVAERRETARLLRESEERLRLALAAAGGIGVWDWDVTKDVVYVDAACAGLYGMDAAVAGRGAPAKEFLRKLHPDDAALVEGSMERALHDRVEFSLEYRIMQPDGSLRWVLGAGRCTYDATGKPLRFPGVVIDITEQKRTEEALRESEARLRSIYSTSLEYIGILSPEGRILDCNRASLEFAGSTREEVAGKYFWEGPWFASTPGMPEQIRAAIAEAATGVTYLREIALSQPSGEVIPFDFSLTPVFDRDGKVIFLVPEGRELRELKRAQRALLESEKIAAVGRLASSIAHEINNPLEAVTNLLYLARQKASLPQVQEYLQAADHELRRVSAIANQTLRFHKQASNPESVEAADLFATVLRIYEGRLRNSRVAVEIRHRAQEPVICFQGDVRQVLNNLVGNAIEAMAGGGRLLIRSSVGRDWATGRTGVTFTVADTGCGMSRETRDQIFEPFFTTKGMAGTGLALWVSHEVVQRHGGTLRVRSRQSAEQHGSVFRFFLPFAARRTEGV